MRIHRLIEETLLKIDSDLQVALEGLTVVELNWSPTNESNSIGFTFWHQTRAEDAWIRDFAIGRQ